MRKGSYSEELVKIGIDFRIRSPSSRRQVSMSSSCSPPGPAPSNNMPG